MPFTGTARYTVADAFFCQKAQRLAGALRLLLCCRCRCFPLSTLSSPSSSVQYVLTVLHKGRSVTKPTSPAPNSDSNFDSRVKVNIIVFPDIHPYTVAKKEGPLIFHFVPDRLRLLFVSVRRRRLRHTIHLAVLDSSFGLLSHPCLGRTSRAGITCDRSSFFLLAVDCRIRVQIVTVLRSHERHSKQSRIDRIGLERLRQRSAFKSPNAGRHVHITSSIYRALCDMLLILYGIGLTNATQLHQQQEKTKASYIASAAVYVDHELATS